VLHRVEEDLAEGLQKILLRVFGELGAELFRKGSRRSAVMRRELTRTETQPGRAEMISMSSTILLSEAACRARLAISWESKGGVKQAKTLARSAAMTLSGVLPLARTMHLSPGRMERISSSSTRFSSMALSGLVMTTPKARMRNRFRASVVPAEYSVGKSAAQRESPMSRLTGDWLSDDENPAHIVLRRVGRFDFRSLALIRLFGLMKSSFGVGWGDSQAGFF